MITKFGKLLRKIRIDHGEILKNMADKLEVSPAFLSAVEIGKKNVPKGWVERISSIYNLSPSETQALFLSAEDAVRSVKIDLLNASDTQRSVAIAFARSFDNMSEDTAKKIFNMMESDRNRED